MLRWRWSRPKHCVCRTSFYCLPLECIFLSSAGRPEPKLLWHLASSNMLVSLANLSELCTLVLGLHRLMGRGATASCPTVGFIIIESLHRLLVGGGVPPNLKPETSLWISLQVDENLLLLGSVSGGKGFLPGNLVLSPNFSTPPSRVLLRSRRL
jgi:hypothetical protein